MSKIAIGIIVVVTILGMGIAASIGMFSASISEPTVAQEIEEVAGNESVTSTLDDANSGVSAAAKLADTTETRAYLTGEPETSLSEAEIASDLKLQEVRDTYLRFTQALPGVSVFYAINGECGIEESCIAEEDPSQILVRKSWAQEASQDEMATALAQAHSEIAVRRIWGSDYRAQRDLQDVLPACEVRRNYDLLVAANATDRTLDLSDPSVQAMKDVVVAVMVNHDVPFSVYPQKFHTSEQIEVAQQIALGELPSLVVAVSSPSC